VEMLGEFSGMIKGSLSNMTLSWALKIEFKYFTLFSNSSAIPSGNEDGTEVEQSKEKKKKKWGYTGV
jgi:hypothetical protein